MKGTTIFLFLVLASILAVAPAITANTSNEHTVTLTLVGNIVVRAWFENNTIIYITQNKTFSFNGSVWLIFRANYGCWLIVNGTIYYNGQYSVVVNTSETVYAKAVPELINVRINLLNQGELTAIYGNNETVISKN